MIDNLRLWELVVAYAVAATGLLCVSIPILRYIDRHNLGNPSFRQLWRHWRSRPRIRLARAHVTRIR